MSIGIGDFAESISRVRAATRRAALEQAIKCCEEAATEWADFNDSPGDTLSQAAHECANRIRSLLEPSDG